jgi:hypothetical protein
MATKTLVSVTALGKAALVALLVSGCAAHPDRIKPLAYAGDKCTAADRKRLVELSAEQKRAANTDAMGVFLIGLPIGSMNGPDHADEIARLKGACRA